MRKLMIASLMTSAVAVAAHAGSISFDSRVDYEARNYNKDAATPDYNRFNVQTMRVDAKGNFDEATSYRLRFRLNGAAPTMRYADSMDNRTDFAYVQRKLMDGLSLQFGKIGTDIGGFEGMTSGADLYMTSQAYSEGTLRYATGAKLTYTVADQEFNLMTVNQQTDSGTTSTTFSQTHEAMGLVYKGSFMDKSLLPYVGYFMDNLQASPVSATDNQKNDYMTVGLKWDAKPVFVEADYSANTFKDKGAVNENDTTTSMVATVGYQMDNWVAKLKYEGSETKVFSALTSTSTKTTYTGMQLAAEYQPTGDKNFRYHVAYTTRDTKPDTAGAKTSTAQTMYAGVKLYADFLK